MNGDPARESLLERLGALEEEVARLRRAGVVPAGASEASNARWGGEAPPRGGDGEREPERRCLAPEGLLRTKKEKLQEAHSRFRLLVETVPYAIEELSADGTILFANPAHRERARRVLAEERPLVEPEGATECLGARRGAEADARTATRHGMSIPAVQRPIPSPLPFVRGRDRTAV